MILVILVIMMSKMIVMVDGGIEAIVKLSVVNDDDENDGSGWVIVGVVWIKWPPLARRDLHFSHHPPSFESF